MNNKVLIQLIVPEIDETYDIYIPINKSIGEIMTLLTKAIFEYTNGIYRSSLETSLYDSVTGNRYSNESIVFDTNIRNGSKIILL